MAISIMTEVWDHSEQKGGALLVLLALADNADKETRLAWPSVADLARRSRLDTRNVQRCLRKLEEDGEIKTVEKGGWVDGKARATVYKVLPLGAKNAPSEPEYTPPGKMPPGGTDATHPPGTECTHPPGTDATPTVITNRHNQPTPAGTQSVTASEFVAQLDEKLRDALVPLTAARKARYGREFKDALRSGRSPDELDNAVDRIADRWHDVQLSVDMALRDCQVGRQTNGQRKKQRRSTTERDRQEGYEWFFA